MNVVSIIVGHAGMRLTPFLFFCDEMTLTLRGTVQ